MKNRTKTILKNSSDQVNETIAEKAVSISEEIDSLETVKTGQDKPVEEY